MNVFQKLAKSDKRAFRQARRGLERENLRYGSRFVKIGNLPAGAGAPIAVYRNRNYLASLYLEGDGDLRLSVNRTQLLSDGNWQGDITWDELMAVKRGIGYQDLWMVEVYPPAAEVVNVTNMRHLFLLSSPPPFAWIKKDITGESEEGKSE